MRIRTVFTIALVMITFCLTSTSVVADTLILRDGSRVEGMFQGATPTAIRFKVRGLHRGFAIDDVQSIIFTPPSTETTETAETVEQNLPILKAAPKMLGVVPEGTLFKVKLSEKIDSTKNAPGHSFSAVLEANLVANDGRIFAHRGAQVFGIVTRPRGSGADTASALTLELTSIVIDDANHAVITELENALASIPALIVPEGRTLTFRLTSPFKL